MKRTIITIKTITTGNKIKSQSRIMLKESDLWRGHGTVVIKIKDWVPVDASMPVDKLTIENIPISAYIKADGAGGEKKD